MTHTPLPSDDDKPSTRWDIDKNLVLSPLQSALAMLIYAEEDEPISFTKEEIDAIIKACEAAMKG